MAIMFTFIIPSVRKDTLEYAVDSVLNQTYQDWKAIVCGDGVYVPPFEDDRILTIIAPRRSLASATRLYAAKYVDTEWIVFLDDDDWVVPHYLETFLPLVDSSDVIVSQMMNYGNVMPTGPGLVHGHVGISFAVRTEAFLREGMPDDPSEDYKFLIHMQTNDYRVNYTLQCGYFVRKFLDDPEFIPTPL
jgi:glycosyltransferase involved in cell wall biosynthesis